MIVDLSNQTIYLAHGTLDLPDEVSILRETLLTHDNEVVLKDGSFWQPPKPTRFMLELFGDKVRKQYFGELASSRVHLVLPPAFSRLYMEQLYTLAIGDIDFLQVGHFMVRKSRHLIRPGLNAEFSLSDTNGLSTYVDGQRSRAS